MRTQVQWSVDIPMPPPEAKQTNQVWAVCFRPDGDQVLLGVAEFIFIYNVQSGEFINKIKGHKDTVFALAYSKDGQRFASGGADNSVVIWSAEGQGLLKYSHNDKILALSFNPVLQTLASCSSIDFGLWMSDGQSVNKTKTPSKCVSCDWSPDGQLLAIGLFNGVILMKDKQGAELFTINKGSAPVWAVTFCPQKFETSDNLLIAGSWDQKLHTYQIQGGKQAKPLVTKDLGFDPCSISFYPKGDFMVMSGSDKKITFWNREGVFLGTVGSMKDWIWSTSVNPSNRSIFAGSNGGTIQLHQVHINQVHGLYQERYAYRELMTDVIIQHLVTETRVKIRCRDYIKKIAIYKDRLAVQLNEKIIIYSVSPEDPYDMKYKAHKKINKKIDCHNLFVFSQHLVLCFDSKIQLLAFNGVLEREWVLETNIKYVKPLSGPPKRESILVGCQDGTVFKIFIDNGFPIPLIKQTTAVSLVDISCDRQKLAVIDEFKSMFVYDVKTQQLLFQERNIESIAWNLEVEDMLAYTGQDTLYIKCRDLPPQQQRLPGYVVGFKGSKIFCLNDNNMNTIDVPQSSTFFRFLERKDFPMAYKLACLGVTEQDWRALGVEALKKKDFRYAKKAFCRIRDLKFIDLTGLAEQMHQMKNLDDVWLAGEILALQGKHKEATSHYIKSEMIDKAVVLLTQMKKFNEALEIIKQHGKKKGDGPLLDPAILIKQAEYELDSGNWKEAAQLYNQASKFKEAIDIYGKKQNLDSLMDICKNLDKTKHKTEIELCAKYFRQAGHHTFAKQAYLRLDDLKALMGLHVELHKWDEAKMLAKQNREMEAIMWLPYADWLSANDQFDQAQEAYKKAGRPDLSLRIIEFLTYNAVVEKRFQDAAQYYWMLSAESLRLVKETGEKATKEDKKFLSSFHEYMKLSEIYQAYHLIHKFIEESYQAVIQGPLFNEAIFHASRFLINSIGKRQPLGISKCYIYYALSVLGFRFETYKTARLGYDKMQKLKIPHQWQEEIDLANLKCKSKPFSDKESYQTLCNRCMNVNQLINNNGDFCSVCGQGFVRNMIGFDTLPLVEFTPAAGIQAKRVVECLKMDPPEESGFAAGIKGKKKHQDGWQENGTNGDEQTLTFNQHDDEMETDLFTQKMLEQPETMSGPEGSRPVEVDERVLMNMRYEEVFIIDYTKFCESMPRRFFKSMVPDVSITMCENCCKFFLQDEYEFSYIEKGHCPFCKNVEKDKVTQNVVGSLADMRH